MGNTVEMIKTKQAAFRLGVTIQRVQQLLSDGFFPGAVKTGVYINSGWVIPLEEVLMYQDGIKVQTLVHEVVFEAEDSFTDGLMKGVCIKCQRCF